MRNEKPIEISVKTVFTGKRSAEQAFIELIKRKNVVKSTNRLEAITKNEYNHDVVFPSVHAPERGLTL